MPKVSIIIPVYNVEKYLYQCLESVQKQTLKDIEVIVVDDGSPDESYKVYQEFEKRDSRFKTIRKENGGVSRARNTGLESATGEYVLFIDSDDWMTEDACEILYSEAVNKKADMVIADTYMSFDDGKNEYVHVFDSDFITSDASQIKAYQKAIIAFPYNHRPYGGRCTIPTGLGGPWNKLVRRDLVMENEIRFDPYVNGMFDDCLYSLHVLANAKKISYVAKPVYYYRMVGTSLLHKYRMNMLETNSHIFERIEDFMKETGEEEFFKPAFDFYVCRRLIESMGAYFFADENPQKFFGRLASLKQIVNEKPYNVALGAVDVNVMKKSWNMITRALHRQKYFYAWAVFRMKQVKTKITEK